MSWRGLSMSILAFLFTAATSTVLIVLGPGEFASRTLLTVLLIPIVWGLSMFYCYWDEVRWRPAAALALVTLISIVLIATTEVQL